MKLGRTIVWMCILFLIIEVTGCSDYSPKPRGYFRIELPEKSYRQLSAYPEFSFDIPSGSIIEPVPDSTGGEWFNIVYPDLDAKIYCGYLPITASGFKETAEDNYRFVYGHAIKADAIEVQPYTCPEQNVYGLVYDIKGNVATPVQFILTDSVRSFFRGSLYFNCTPNRDSIAPVVNYIREDIRLLMESFRWKN